MKLVGDIINELMDSDKAISGPLLKTKVLAARINNQNLIKWVNGELSGYKESANLPDYRKTKGILRGSYLNGNMQYSNTSIPTAHLENEKVNSLSAIEIKESISSIENLIKEKGIKISVNSYAKAFLEDSIRSIGNHYFQIISIHLDIPATFLSDILSNVRSKLLDFMLELENQFGQETEIEKLKENQSTINYIMNSTISTNGDGNVITSGNENSIKAHININKDNKEDLREYLLGKGIENEDINDLINVIDIEAPKSKDNFNEPVNNWIKKMIKKALDGSWQIGISTAGGVLAEGLQRYYGI